MVEFVADVPGTHPGARGDLVVFEFFPVLQLEEFAVAVIQLGHQQAQRAQRFQPAEVAIRGAARAFPLVGFIERGFPPTMTEMIEREILQTAVKPRPGLAHLLPVLLELEKGVLHQVFRRLPHAGQTEGVTQQCGLSSASKICLSVARPSVSSWKTVSRGPECGGLEG